MIRVLVVDDHAAVRATLADFLAAHDDIEVCAQAGDGAAALRASEACQPDVVVMDVRMPVLDGIEATRLIKSRSADARVLLVSAYEDPEIVDAGARAGADGFVLKGTLGAELVERVRMVCR